jgi:hypothetical protein
MGLRRKPEMSAPPFTAEYDKLSTRQAHVATSRTTELTVVSTTATQRVSDSDQMATVSCGYSGKASRNLTGRSFLSYLLPSPLSSVPFTPFIPLPRTLLSQSQQ